MRRLLAILIAAVLSAPLLAQARAAAPSVRMRQLEITVTVPAEGALGPSRCTLDASLFTPPGVDRGHPAPALLMTSGYGRSKLDLYSWGMGFARRGFVVLDYSGLGFGADPQTGRQGSGCRITFDDRQHDGAAASQMIDFLGGLRPADDGSRIDDVVLDQVAHDGRHHAGDPRVGVVGLSYGGETTFAVAGIDPRVDTIVPMQTWNDLTYTLSPNNAGLEGDTLTSRAPGAERVQWNAAFLAEGLDSGLNAAEAGGTQSALTRFGPCPNFSDAFCGALSSLAALGYADGLAQGVMRNASVASYMKDIRVPVLLTQGETDQLFTLREAIATYASLRAHHVPVKMVWHHWGHDAGTLHGEVDMGHPGSEYLDRVILTWLDHYLMGAGPAPSLDFSYYAPWRDTGDAGRAFVTLASYPSPGSTTLYASGTRLQLNGSRVVSGSTAIVAPGSAPLSSTEPAPLVSTPPAPDTPLTTAILTTGPLLKDVDVVGAPTARLRLSSPTALSAIPSTMLVAFVKLYDVAPDGSVDPATHLVAPIRVDDLSRPVTVALPGLVHRFPAGHSIELVVTLTDACCVGNAQPQVAALSTSAAAPTTLTLPGRLDAAAFAHP